MPHWEIECEWQDGRGAKKPGEMHPQSVNPTLASRGLPGLANLRHSGANAGHAANDISGTQ